MSTIPQNVQITYWHDTTSGDDAWIVDIGDDDGCETLSEHQTQAAARLEALRQGMRRGLPVYFVSEHGEKTTVRRHSFARPTRIKQWRAGFPWAPWGKRGL